MPQQKPLISIILPSFNGSKYIRESIESCLSQTHELIELIIVNDCSTDDTPSIIGEYAARDKRVIVLNNEQNIRLPASLNKGFAQAKGRYFTWTSDDNRFAPDALANLLAELEKEQNTDIIYSSYYFMNAKGSRLDKFGGPPEELLFKCIVGSCFLYKREVHETLQGFDTTKFRMEDLDFWLRAAVKFTFGYVDIPHLYFYRKHEDSLSHEIIVDHQVNKEYRDNHIRSFAVFFKEGLNLDLTKDQLEDHIQLYFEEMATNGQSDFRITDRVISCMHHLDLLASSDWSRVGFDQKTVEKIVLKKRDRMISLVINGLVFNNKILQNKNPRLASELSRPISWYYKEYEVLPLWFKRIGHIIKVIRRNKPFTSLFKNTGTP
jgi:glycosyltransferase involved in cell wall biosynthesis